jgi:hypothetical protein
VRHYYNRPMQGPRVGLLRLRSLSEVGAEAEKIKGSELICFAQDMNVHDSPDGVESP